MPNAPRIVYVDLMETLRALAAEKAPHAKYLAHLERVEDPMAAAIDEPLPSGVSRRVALALADDLCYLRSGLAGEDQPGASYPNAYRARRQADARATAARLRRQYENGQGLGSLLPGTR